MLVTMNKQWLKMVIWVGMTVQLNLWTWHDDKLNASCILRCPEMLKSATIYLYTLALLMAILILTPSIKSQRRISYLAIHVVHDYANVS